MTPERDAAIGLGNSTPLGRPTTAEALWTATERLRVIEEAAPVGIVALDLNGRITIWNRTASELFGWTADEICGCAQPLVPTDKQDEEHDLTARVLAGAVISGTETICIRKDGTLLTVSLSCSPIRNAEGNVCGTMRVFTDVSEAKRLARQFLQAQKMEAFGQLAGGIAHDFNNLLTIINGFSDLVMERVRDQPGVTADMQEIKNAGDRAAQLTRQLLAFSRKQIWVTQVLDLGDVIHHFEKMLGRIVRENITLTLATSANLGHTKADPGQVEQLVMNLVINARDAMPHGGNVTIATANVIVESGTPRPADLAPGRYVSLTVTDTGSGMTPEILARVFEPFFTTKGPGKGTGLGLSTVFGLVEQSGGRITIDSTPGVGTAVTTYWPMVNEPVESLTIDPVLPAGDGTETILLVEDEIGVRTLIGKVLERYGYTVLTASDGAEALAIEAKYQGTISLLVSDMIMPGMSGADLAQCIAQRRPAIQVLFVSGYASREAIDRGMGGTNASFLQKPFRPETLAQKVRERLDRHPQPTSVIRE